MGGTGERDRTIGIRELLSDVNLRDFFDMVRGELALVAGSARAALEARPILLPLVLLLAVVRFVLLALVIVVLGGAIFAITVVRGMARIVRRSAAA